MFADSFCVDGTVMLINKELGVDCDLSCSENLYVIKNIAINIDSTDTATNMPAKK